MTLEAFTNYIQIADRLASSGQPEEHQFRYIAKAEYQLVINLAMPNSENAIPEEDYMIAALKMAYVHIPVPFEAPNVDHLKAFIRCYDGIFRPESMDSLRAQLSDIRISLSTQTARRGRNGGGSRGYAPFLGTE